MQHYAILYFVTHATRLIVLLNLLFLSCIPFPTGLHAVHVGD